MSAAHVSRGGVVSPRAPAFPPSTSFGALRATWMPGTEPGHDALEAGSRNDSDRPVGQNEICVSTRAQGGADTGERIPSSNQSNSRACRRDPAARGVREMQRRPPSTMMRAQGMPGEGLAHGPPANKNAGGRYHRFSRTSGIPCAAVLTLIRDLLGAPGLLATVATTRVTHAIAGHQHRGVRTTRLHVRKRIIRPHH